MDSFVLVIDDNKFFAALLKTFSKEITGSVMSLHNYLDSGTEMCAKNVVHFLETHLKLDTPGADEIPRSLALFLDSQKISISHIFININLGPRRSARHGLAIFKALRCHLRIGIPIVCFSFEPQADLITSKADGILEYDEGYSCKFLQLPIAQLVIDEITETMESLDAKGLTKLIQHHCNIVGRLCNIEHRLGGDKKEISRDIQEFRQLLHDSSYKDRFVNELQEIDDLVESYGSSNEERKISAIRARMEAIIKNIESDQNTRR